MSKSNSISKFSDHTVSNKLSFLDSLLMWEHPHDVVRQKERGNLIGILEVDDPTDFSTQTRFYVVSFLIAYLVSVCIMKLFMPFIFPLFALAFIVSVAVYPAMLSSKLKSKLLTPYSHWTFKAKRKMKDNPKYLNENIFIGQCQKHGLTVSGAINVLHMAVVDKTDNDDSYVHLVSVHKNNEVFYMKSLKSSLLTEENIVKTMIDFQNQADELTEKAAVRKAELEAQKSFVKELAQEKQIDVKFEKKIAEEQMLLEKQIQEEKAKEEKEKKEQFYSLAATLSKEI